METTTNCVAWASLFSPVWLDRLHTGAQWLLPFLGAAWLVMQMYYKLKNEKRKREA